MNFLPLPQEVSEQWCGLLSAEYRRTVRRGSVFLHVKTREKLLGSVAEHGISYSTFLIGLLAALIPVAIHLIRREKPPKVMFSTIRFLKKTSKKLVLFQHLQQIALLLLRAAVIVLLVLAFARPLFNQSVARLLDADPQSAVILLDLSMSMRWQDNFDQAKAEALAVVDRLSGGDELGLIAFSGAAEVVRELDTEVGSSES